VGGFYFFDFSGAGAALRRGGGSPLARGGVERKFGALEAKNAHPKLSSQSRALTPNPKPHKP